MSKTNIAYANLLIYNQSFLLFISFMRKLLNIERVILNFRKKVDQFFFAKVTRNKYLKDENRCKKICNYKSLF